MRVLQPVLWAKGTFLTPQHLQAQDRFIEDLLQFGVEALHFKPWGFRSLEMDHEALAGGAAGIRAASGLFPDGTPFRIPEADAPPAARPLGECFQGDRNEVVIYFALPEYRDHALNIAAPGSNATARYIAEVEMFRDENTGTTERPVQVARRNLRLLVEGEHLRGHTLLAAAKVRRTAGDVLEFDPSFVPPLVDLAGSRTLQGMARRLLEILSAKSSMLGAVRRQKNLSLAEFTVSDIASFWLLYAVNSHLPDLRHLHETRGGHPEELFMLMASLASALTTFSQTVQPRDLPLYDHENLGPCFAELEARLLYLLETVVPSNFVSLPLRLVRPSIYAATLGDEKYLHDTRMFLAMRADTDEAELIDKAPRLLKVCSATHVEHLVRQALPGVPLRHQVSPPSQIPVKLDHQYFSLSQSGLAWEAIERSRNVAVYVPGDFPNPELELIIVLPAT